MSASRRLLGSRNVSFAPQLGIKGLVSVQAFILRTKPKEREIVFVLNNLRVVH